LLFRDVITYPQRLVFKPTGFVDQKGLLDVPEPSMAFGNCESTSCGRSCTTFQHVISSSPAITSTPATTQR